MAYLINNLSTCQGGLLTPLSSLTLPLWDPIRCMIVQTTQNATSYTRLKG